MILSAFDMFWRHRIQWSGFNQIRDQNRSGRGRSCKKSQVEEAPYVLAPDYELLKISYFGILKSMLDPLLFNVPEKRVTHSQIQGKKLQVAIYFH